MSYSDTYLIVTAAGSKTWLREKLTPGAWVRMLGEGLVSDYQEKMEVLREVDDKIYDWLKDLNKIVKEMESSFKANRLIDVAISLAEINQRLKQAMEEGKKVENLQQKSLEEFDEEHQKELPEDLEGKLAKAGIIDDWKRKFVNKKFQDKIKRERTLALQRLINTCKNVVESVNIQLDQLSQFRASGDLGKYIQALGKISLIQNKFYQNFSKVYQQYLEPIVKRIREKQKEDEILEPVKKVSPPKSENFPSTIPNSPLVATEPMLQQPASSEEVTLPNAPSISDSEIEEVTPSSEMRSTQILPESGERKTLQLEPDDRPTLLSADSEPEEFHQIKFKEGPSSEEPITESEPTKLRIETAAAKIDKEMMKIFHQDFMKNLIKSSQNYNQYELGFMICKYAEEIYPFQPEESFLLLTLAEGLLENE